MTYTLSDIKQLPAMRMEGMIEEAFAYGNGYSKEEMDCMEIRNALRKQILSELTSKPTVTNSKKGKE